MKRLLILASLIVLGCGNPAEEAAVALDAPVGTTEVTTGDRWRQWGGPNADFRVEAGALASSWAVEGPPELWSRELGAGYSAIAADAGTLYTMYRDGGDDVVVALGANDGQEIWSHRYAAPTREQNQTQFGEGPNAMPLVLDDRIVTLGYGGLLHALDRDDGSVLWSHDLIGDFGGEVLAFGYSASPVLIEGNVVVLVGGETQGAMAFDPADGSVAWRGDPSSVSYATPRAIEVGGQLQIAYFSADEVIGIDARNGKRLWGHPCVNQYDNNATGVQWDGNDTLWVVTQLDGGSRALKLVREGEATRVEELWSNDKIKVHFWNTLMLDGHVYASIGSNGSILAGTDMKSGEILWRERGFEKANLIHAGERSLLLDAEGHLALVELTPAGIEIVSQTRIVEEQTWTPPTLAGQRLYMRDKRTIRALDLSPQG